MPLEYHLFPKALTPIECSELVGYAVSSYPSQQAVVGYGGRAHANDMRRSDIRWLDVADPRLAELCMRLRKYLLQANAKTLGVEYRDFMDLQFTQYAGWNQGHYDWHRDDHPDATEPPWDRKLSAVIQLSPKEAYVGGKLELETGLPEGAFLEQGDLIVFKSSTKHRVTPVTRGVRWSLVTWAMGPRDPILATPPTKKSSRARRSKV